jgi:hypothetical protein
LARCYGTFFPWLLEGEGEHMMEAVSVRVHESLFPQNTREELLLALRQREIPPKMHYQTTHQVLQWLELFRTHSPHQRRADFRSFYEEHLGRAFSEANAEAVLSLGVGDGSKERECLRSPEADCVRYFPCDVSIPMVLQAAYNTRAFGARCEIVPLACDMACALDPTEFLRKQIDDDPALILALGLIPNVDPVLFFTRISSILSDGDLAVISANLAPGENYLRGVQTILPGYENPQTRRWLGLFLKDLGVDLSQGEYLYTVEAPAGIPFYRVRIDFRFHAEVQIQLWENPIIFKNGDAINLFYSYRHRPDLLIDYMSQFNLRCVQHAVHPSGEEGLFLIRKK